MQIINLNFLSSFSITEIFLVLTFFMFILFLALRYNVGTLYNNCENLLIENSKELKGRAEKLRNLEISFLKEEQPKELKDKEMDHIIDEIKKVSKLWKSRRERLKMGLWKSSKEGEEEEKALESAEIVEEYGAESELQKLKKEKERIEELIRRTKIKYHKREIDEESFREIIKDYQKDLMEITMRISELESES